MVLALFLGLEGHLIVLQAVAWAESSWPTVRALRSKFAWKRLSMGSTPASCAALSKKRDRPEKNKRSRLLQRITLLCDLHAEFVAPVPAFRKLSFSDVWYEMLLSCRRRGCSSELIGY